LQGFDAGGTPDTPTLIESDDGAAFAGVAVAGWVVLFPVDTGTAVESLSYTAPVATRHLVTGLAPGSQWDIVSEPSGDDEAVTIQPGTSQTADDAGVLLIEM
jgi:hypothetical protein